MKHCKVTKKFANSNYKTTGKTIKVINISTLAWKLITCEFSFENFSHLPGPSTPPLLSLWASSLSLPSCPSRCVFSLLSPSSRLPSVFSRFPAPLRFPSALPQVLSLLRPFSASPRRPLRRLPLWRVAFLEVRRALAKPLRRLPAGYGRGDAVHAQTHLAPHPPPSRPK